MTDGHDDDEIKTVESGGDALADGEDCTSDNLVFATKVNLEKVEVSGGEEDEEVLLKLRAKLFVFVPEDVYGGETRQNFWKERGTGEVKLLKHREHKKVRILMRQEKTLKICANHLISPGVVMTANVGSDRSFVFTAMDYADEELSQDTFAIRFSSVENATKFKDMIELSKKVNGGEMDADELKPETPDPLLEKPSDKQSDAVENSKENSKHDETADSVPADALAAGMDKVRLHSMVGGFSPSDISSDEVKEIAEFAATSIGKGTLHEILEAAKQVVAGLIFKIKIKIKYSCDESIHFYSATVFRPLPHTKEPLVLKDHAHLESE